MLKPHYIIECRKKFTGKAQVTKLKATDFTDALIRFKEQRLLKNLPYNTIIACAQDNTANFYPKGV